MDGKESENYDAMKKYLVSVTDIDNKVHLTD